MRPAGGKPAVQTLQMLPRSPAPAAAIALMQSLQFLVLIRGQFLVNPVEHDRPAFGETPPKIPHASHLERVGDLVNDPLEGQTFQFGILLLELGRDWGQPPRPLLKKAIDLLGFLDGEADLFPDKLVVPPFATNRAGRPLALARPGRVGRHGGLGLGSSRLPALARCWGLGCGPSLTAGGQRDCQSEAEGRKHPRAEVQADLRDNHDKTYASQGVNVYGAYRPLGPGSLGQPGEPLNHLADDVIRG